ncbi:MAG: ATP-binding cassette domain-containing protein [Paracoccaceae bacterium]|nr:ATP-binding cassette domain-containing protein [Paracoccaceae bacterium]
MLRFDGVEVRQGDFVMRADLALTPDAVTAVIGPSGSGKSTLLATAAGFVTPERGEVRIGGEPVTRLAPADRPVSIVFQDGNLFPHLDIATNLALGRDPGGRVAAYRDEIETALARVGLEGLGSRRPGELSGGQQSRAALARAFLRHRPVVLLDEPFAALGPALRREMLALTAEIFADATVLIVTHAPEDARAIAAETIFVDGGVARSPAPTAALLDDPPPSLRAYL